MVASLRPLIQEDGIVIVAGSHLTIGVNELRFYPGFLVLESALVELFKVIDGARIGAKFTDKVILDLTIEKNGGWVDRLLVSVSTQKDGDYVVTFQVMVTGHGLTNDPVITKKINVTFAKLTVIRNAAQSVYLDMKYKK